MATPIYGTLLFGPDQMMLEDGSKLNTWSEILGRTMFVPKILIENTKIARRILVRKGVPIVSEDVEWRRKLFSPAVVMKSL
jgi:hypothetical protein